MFRCTVRMIQKHLNPTLRLSSILLTMYDGRTRLGDRTRSDWQRPPAVHAVRAARHESGTVRRGGLRSRSIRAADRIGTTGPRYH